MSYKQSFLKSNNDEIKRDNYVASKLRRLKIEGNLLLQSLKKLDQKRNYEVPGSDSPDDAECKNMIKYLKDSHIKIKNSFDDLKIVTSSQELIAELEIDEIKKKVLELETTMRAFKLHINTELSTLKKSEQELLKELEEVNLRDSNLDKRAKISSVSFKQAVPSPVRLMMTSPLKCIEVQQFQDFMETSPNRFGGWNEYYHNIFVKLWQKHFENAGDTRDDDLLVENLALDNFVEETLFKLQGLGIDKKSVLSHVGWYKKYLFLKSKQQTAIDKWKSNRRPMRKTPDDKQVCCAGQSQVGDTQKQKCLEMKKKLELTKPIKRKMSKDDIERVMAPTKQWLSRCEDEQRSNRIQSIENLKKLRIPNWRQYL